MIEIRFARREDAALLAEFICALAEYERLSDECFVTREKIETTMFGENPRAEALIAHLDGAPAGFALFFHNYSTFLTQPGLYLEDLFVKPDFRRRGIGAALFNRLAQIACERKCGRFEWSALDWNTPAIEFYKKMGARAMAEWTVFRLTGSALEQYADAKCLTLNPQK
jgi:GNAT superfamily N-acetyltransferase